jgi:hypothetical protein
MNGCFIDAVGLEFPFKADDFLNDADMQMISGDVPIPTESAIKSDKVMWNNWSSPMEPTHSSDKEQPAPMQVLNDAQEANEAGKRVWSGASEMQKEMFNGTAVITNVKLKHMVHEWIQDTFHEDYIDTLWTSPMGMAKYVPVTLLCFNKSSAWHKEGPIDIPNYYPSNFHTGIVTRFRPPAVCNFRLLGDIDDSYLQFAKSSERMRNTELSIQDEFFKNWLVDSGGTEKDGVWEYTVKTDPPILQKRIDEAHNIAQAKQYAPHIKLPNFPDFVIRDRLKVAPSTNYIVDPEYWKDDIEIIETHVGMHNPYFVNINQWHRVVTNGQPRVTFRVHANPLKMTFKKVEEMYEAGKLLK